MIDDKHPGTADRKNDAAPSGDAIEPLNHDPDLAEISDQEELLEAVSRYQEITLAGSSVFKKYYAAIREMRTRFEILNDDLEYRTKRNPIHHIESRLKKPRSIFSKMERYGLPVSISNMEENIRDIAGIRVICSYLDDVYGLVKMLGLQDDLEILTVKDYIAQPKPNGYRSLHVIVSVPIFFLDQKEYVPVEVQFRTIAMDFWASLEHSLKYKRDVKTNGIDIVDELRDCSSIIEDVERRMQIMLDAVEEADAQAQTGDVQVEDAPADDELASEHFRPTVTHVLTSHS